MKRISNNLLTVYIKYLLRFVLRPRATLSCRKICGLQSYSEAGQDLFAVLMNNEKRDGFYLEIGAQDPIKNSNTFLLEEKYNWRGVSFELRQDFSTFFNLRRINPCIRDDATKINYQLILEELQAPTQIDFLQVDIEPAEATLKALQSLPHERYRFSTIAFEHDGYQNDGNTVEESRKFLRSMGYVLYAANVMHNNRPFEDWWFDPQVFSAIRKSKEPRFQNQEYTSIVMQLIKDNRIFH